MKYRNKQTLEQKLKELKESNKWAAEHYGSELCAGDMIRKEEAIEKQILLQKQLAKTVMEIPKDILTGVPDRLLKNDDKVGATQLTSNKLKYIKMKSIFGQGLFIRNDDSGNPCCIGDRVEVIRPEMNIPHEDWRGEETLENVPETTFTGTLVLLKSRGVRIKLNTGIGTNYIKPPITNRSRNIWKWRKL